MEQLRDPASLAPNPRTPPVPHRRLPCSPPQTCATAHDPHGPHAMQRPGPRGANRATPTTDTRTLPRYSTRKVFRNFCSLEAHTARIAARATTRTRSPRMRRRQTAGPPTSELNSRRAHADRSRLVRGRPPPAAHDLHKHPAACASCNIYRYCGDTQIQGALVSASPCATQNAHSLAAALDMATLPHPPFLPTPIHHPGAPRLCRLG